MGLVPIIAIILESILVPEFGLITNIRALLKISYAG
jgi:hypothetical protein